MRYGTGRCECCHEHGRGPWAELAADGRVEYRGLDLWRGERAEVCVKCYEEILRVNSDPFNLCP